MKNQFKTSYFTTIKDSYIIETLINLAFEFCVFLTYFLFIHLVLVPDVAPEDIIKAKMLFYIPLIILYTIEIPLEYLSVIKLLIDTKKEITITETVYFKNYKHELSITGKNLVSRVARLFPRDMGVGKFRLFFTREDGSVLFTRSIISFKKRDVFYNWGENGKSQIPLQITYLKNSKVLVCVEPVRNFEYDKKTILQIINLNNSI